MWKSDFLVKFLPSDPWMVSVMLSVMVSSMVSGTWSSRWWTRLSGRWPRYLELSIMNTALWALWTMTKVPGALDDEQGSRSSLDDDQGTWSLQWWTQLSRHCKWLKIYLWVLFCSPFFSAPYCPAQNSVSDPYMEVSLDKVICSVLLRENQYQLDLIESEEDLPKLRRLSFNNDQTVTDTHW